ncbi:MAG: hypothetical protein LBO75_00400, partial [Bifidobacteriaceae bacterium]|nr:hypothetical protein [Bifidobacteriaceae bacterium]
NARRLEQADATGAALVATACPFCSTMLGDAAAAAESPLAVQDVAQLLLAALPEPPEVPAEPDLQPPTKPSTTSLAGKGNS